MKKVFIIHGFEGSPNGGWRPWLMSELQKIGVYACALSMPSPETPLATEWCEEIKRHIERNKNDEIFLVGHSLGVPAILRYLESVGSHQISGAILVSGPIKTLTNKKIANFLDRDFDFKMIRKNCAKFSVIHGGNDSVVPIENAEELSKNLGCESIVIPGGGHLNGSSGCYSLPECLNAFERMLSQNSIGK